MPADVVMSVKTTDVFDRRGEGDTVAGSKSNSAVALAAFIEAILFGR
jgi:hypothetical protein